MTQGLNVGRLVSVTVNLQPLAAARRGFGTLLIAGDSNVINGSERIRNYVDIESVAADFGTSAPEYLAASLYFGQSPRPQELMIGRWIRSATSGILNGGILTSTEQGLSNWTVITNGSFKITIDGSEKTLTGLNFSSVTNLNGVASAINASLTGGTVSWDGSRFIVTSSTTGTSSTVGFAVAASTGTNISGLLKLTSSTALTPVPGFAAETPVEAVAALANQSGLWYGLSFAASAMPSSSEYIAVGAFIEAASISRIFGVTETDTRVLDATYTSDLASEFEALGYKRTCVQFSANPYAVCSMMGRAFSVNFSANRSTITLMYKQEPGVVAQNLTETQAQTLKAKRCNVFVNYQNNTAIIQYGVMSGQAYFDEIHGLDWFADALQTAEYNLLYQSKTKIPQTDAGQNQLVNAAANVCQEAINNGLIAPGQWNADGFGQLSRGDYLDEGFYIYTPPMASQDQSIREQRIAPPIQIALKLAGAIHEIDCIVDVNR
jgi:hypothetical protein